MGKPGIKTIDFELSGHLSNSNVVRCHFLVILGPQHRFQNDPKMAPKLLYFNTPVNVIIC